MNDAFGEKFAGKVDCIGLHGDYEAGLQFIREGKLGQLRETSNSQSIDNEAAVEDSPELAPQIPIIGSHGETKSEGMVSPAQSGSDAGREFVDESPLASAITDTSSEMSKLDSDAGPGSWSPPDALSLDSKPSATVTNVAAPRKETDRPLHLVFLGSSLGNFPRDAAGPFLKSLPLRSGDTLLLGLDGRPAPGDEGRKKVEVAYNDPAGHTRAFEEHGWDVVRDEIGIQGDAGVEFVGRYNEELGQSPSSRKGSSDC